MAMERASEWRPKTVSPSMKTITSSGCGLVRMIARMTRPIAMRLPGWFCRIMTSSVSRSAPASRAISDMTNSSKGVPVPT
jgi:hypothetical protein